MLKNNMLEKILANLLQKGENMEIKLRDLIEEDLKSYEMYHSPSNKWMEYNGPYYGQITNEELKKDIEDIKNKLKNNEKPWKHSKVIADVQTNKLIGSVNWYWKSKETNWLEIGLVIFDETLWSKGIGYQALKLWINQVFKDRPEIVRIGLSTWSGNIGMIKLSEKLGLKKEAEYKNARIVKGEYYDSISYGILKEEWYKLNK